MCVDVSGAEQSPSLSYGGCSEGRHLGQVSR